MVKGVDDVLVRLSRCCNPVPGDDILGFVTRGRGVSVHRADCPNAIELKKEPERIIDVSWEGTPSASSYQVEVYIEGIDRTNLLLDVTRVFSETGTNVLSCTTNTHRDGMVEMTLSVPGLRPGGDRPPHQEPRGSRRGFRRASHGAGQTLRKR